MAKRKTTKKSNPGKVIGATLLAALVVGGVGVAGWLTKGFTEAPTFEISKKEETRENLRTFDFTTTSSGELTSQSLITFLNAANKEEETVFSSVVKDEDENPYIAKVFKDSELGLRLGSSSATGHFSVDFEDDFTFTHVKVKAVNYYRMKTDGSKTYNKQASDSVFQINDADEITLEGDDDNTVAYDVVTEELKFDEKQDVLTIVGVEGRPCILSLELWSE